MTTKFFSKFLLAVIFSGGIGLSAAAFAAEANPPATTNAPATGKDTDPKLVEAAIVTNQEALRSLLEVQDQIHNLQVANEKTAAQMSNRVNDLEGLLASKNFEESKRQLEDLKSAQHQNEVMLKEALIFAVVGFLVLVLAAVMHWITFNKFAKVIEQLPKGLALGAGKGPTAITVGSAAAAMLPSPAVEQSTERLLEIMGRLEKRILEIEAATEAHAALPGNGGAKAQLSNGGGNGSAIAMSTGGEAADSVALLLSKGQTLLKLDQPEEALACFEEVLALEQGNVEALLKKGAALERLQRLDEAIECYDRVIATDSTATMAYLYKGGVFNRLERYTEALECYEQALRTQEKGRAANVIID